MDSKINSLDFLSDTLGSYDPYSLRILVNKTYSEGLEGLSGIDSFNKRDFATLFHEFVHQLQNTSSIVGFQQFNAMVSVWHNTRNISYDSCDDESAYLRQEAVNILQAYPCHKNIGPQKKNLLDITKIENLEDIKKQEFTKQAIKISYSYNSSHFELQFGIGEFYESCADVLERFFCMKIKIDDNDFESNSIPYRIGESIAKEIYPECSDFRLIILLLTALQHASPHQMFIFLIHTYGKNFVDDEFVREECNKHVKDLVEINAKWIAKTSDMINKGFPFDDPYLGDVIKSFDSAINKNLNSRMVTPFIELDFLMEINEYNYKEKIKLFIKNAGGSLIYAKDQSNNSPGKVERIVIGNYESIYHNHKGWLTFNISLFLTMKNTKAIIAIETDHNEKYKCPVFIYCDHKNKIKNCNYCNATPYKYTQPLEGADNCAHQLALFKTDLRSHYRNG